MTERVSNQPKNPEIKDLIKTLKENKDAVLIIGDKCAPDSFRILENSKEIFNRKTMVKNPKEFWTWYNDNVYLSSQTISDEEKAINELIATGVFKTVVNLNNTGHISSDTAYTVELKGNKNFLRCMFCDDIYEYVSVNSDEIANEVIKCERCRGKIAPTVVMFEEKYRKANTDAIKDAIFKEVENSKIELNTHVIIFVGVDFKEDYMDEIMDSFDAIKDRSKSIHYKVMICDKDGINIEYYQPEFATFDNIKESIERLTALLKGDE